MFNSTIVGLAPRWGVQTNYLVGPAGFEPATKRL
jgi:hypothetical protein